MQREKWCWIELIGFDNESADYGVESFLSRLHGSADGVSLLFSDVDFINLHESTEREIFLRPVDCSYGGHPWSEERARQSWTNLQLKGLVGTLQSRGVRVLCAFFNFCSYTNDSGDTVESGFCKEIRNVNADGVRLGTVNVLKRFDGGEYYEDFLFKKMREVKEYYGFDGFQVADGISSSRPTVENGDFSDDMAGQFYDFGGVAVEGGIKKRRAYILENLRYEWTVFLTDRWKVFYDKLYAAFDESTILLFNSVWTRDPFEAIYRYGLDYKKVITDRAYGIMIEETSATSPIMGIEDQGGFYTDVHARDYVHYEFILMQQSIKCCLEGKRQITMSSVKDTQEQWDLLRHAPTELQRAVIRRNNNPVILGGKTVNCSNGALYCLSDSMKKEDWDYIGKNEDVCVFDGEEPIGFVPVWSDGEIYSQLRDYIQTRDYPSNGIYQRFMTGSLTMCGMVRADEIKNTDKPLLIANPDFFTAEEKQAVEDYRYPAVLVGKAKCFSGGLEIKDGQFDIVIKNIDFDKNERENLTKKLKTALKVEKCDKNAYDFCGGLWTYPLKVNEVNAEVFSILSETLNKKLSLPYIEKSPSRAKLTVYKKADGGYKILVSNDEHFYTIAKVTMPKKLSNLKSLLKYHGYQIKQDGNSFFIRIPPRGIEVVLGEN